jgi:hypothetical protein
MIQMASGDPVDIQREKRWPNRTGNGTVKVEFKPHEEDSDVTDSEDELIPKGVVYHYENDADQF